MHFVKAKPGVEDKTNFVCQIILLNLTLSCSRIWIFFIRNLEMAEKGERNEDTI